MTTEKYNGWTNRETWLVNLYYEHVLTENLQEYMYHQETHEHRQVTKQELAEYLNELFDVLINEEYEGLSGFMQDMLDFSKIDWYDLVDSYACEVTK